MVTCVLAAVVSNEDSCHGNVCVCACSGGIE